MRTALVWYLANALGVYILLEQPDHRSVGMFKNSRMQRLAEDLTVTWCEFLCEPDAAHCHMLHSHVCVPHCYMTCGLQCYKIFVDMAAYGKFSLKPTVLWSNHSSWLQFLSIELSDADRQRLRARKVETARRVWEPSLRIIFDSCVLQNGVCNSVHACVASCLRMTRRNAGDALATNRCSKTHSSLHEFFCQNLRMCQHHIPAYKDLHQEVCKIRDVRLGTWMRDCCNARCVFLCVCCVIHDLNGP